LASEAEFGDQPEREHRVRALRTTLQDDDVRRHRHHLSLLAQRQCVRAGRCEYPSPS
uniref:Copper-containing nitrite reductase n=1 Tax=Heligmosomoides polygyrus TaxID=6339 RepID=A0A183FA44_HELPZ